MASEDLDIFGEIKRVLELEGNAILSCARRLGSTEGRPEGLPKGLDDQAHGMRDESVVIAVRCFQDALDRGGKIVVIGVGKSGKVGQKIAATLCSTGSLAVFLHPTEGLHGDLGMVSPRDTIMALSYTGNTEEIVRLLPSFKSLGVKVVGIGGNDKSKLAGQCDVWIDASVEQEACPHNLAPTASTTLMLAIGDALAIALMQLRGFDKHAFAKNHPGGSIGLRLNLMVRDIMHSGDAVAIVHPDAPMDDVVIESTRKKLGAVLVAEGRTLRGIITDGDIRRALKHREKFFRMRAEEVMTREPITVRPEWLASRALELMENRSSQIGVLPVVGHDGGWAGLVRLHDLAKLF